MKVLIACEFSGVVRDAFTANGFDAVSCDLEETETEGSHYKGDIRDVLNNGWDLMIAHPPCTHLAVSGARWFKYKVREQQEALEFVRTLLEAPIKFIAVENPISIISSRIRKPDQIVQPWEYGHPEVKTTCLWLKNLPLLVPTKIMGFAEQKVWEMAPSPTRSKDRSRTYRGIAEAMASQWGAYIFNRLHLGG
jgi:site-specific DNA-cytosine methylase